MDEAQSKSGALICQSCGMPMEKPTDFGTEAGGAQSQEYCFFCYSNGSFTEAEITLEQMIDKVTKMMAKAMNVSEDEAGAIAKVSVPNLKRWSGLRNL